MSKSLNEDHQSPGQKLENNKFYDNADNVIWIVLIVGIVVAVFRHL